MTSHTLCCRSRNGSSINIPPSWTIHQMSMVPSVSRSWWGKLSMFLATSRAWWAAVVSRIVSAEGGGKKFMLQSCPWYGLFKWEEWFLGAIQTYEALPWLRVIRLFPGRRPSHQDAVVFHPTETGWLDEVWDAVTQVGRHHHVTESFGLVSCHGRFDVLWWWIDYI